MAARPLFGRSEILEGRVSLVRDCYNANPESMARAIEFCDSLEWQGRKIYVLGDMLELGDGSREAHENIGRLLAGSKADAVFFYGDEMKAAAPAMEAPGAPEFRHFDSKEALSRALDAFARPGDLVLLKGSRSCGLEDLTDMLVGAKAGGGES
jgi:UDP-N-acetylmuramoyl-tripeptide--D-alanyl-D-alanine ligase